MMRYAALIALMVAFSAPAVAKKDPRPPSAQQMVQIEQALRAQGFVRWAGVRRDDGGFEIDSVWDRQGRRFEIKLNSALRIVRSERED